MAFEAVGRTREQKPVVYFRGKQKGLLLNRMLAKSISVIAGSDR